MTDSYFTIKRRDRLRFFLSFFCRRLCGIGYNRILRRIAVFGRIGSMGKK